MNTQLCKSHSPDPCWYSRQGGIQKPTSTWGLDCFNFEFSNGALSLNAPLFAISVPTHVRGEPAFVSSVCVTSHDQRFHVPKCDTRLVSPVPVSSLSLCQPSSPCWHPRVSVTETFIGRWADRQTDRKADA